MTQGDAAGPADRDAEGIARIEKVVVAAYTVPTDLPESDGTLEWIATTMVVVNVFAGGKCGLGYSYADTATAELIRDTLVPLLVGRDATAIAHRWSDMVRAIRNLGRPGIASMAISAVDNALWDLKAKIVDLPLVTFLGAVRNSIPVYGSGGFTSYTETQLSNQLRDWATSDITMVKMKIGRVAAHDVARVKVARDAIGPATDLFVDANGSYSRKQALEMAGRFSDFGVSWFEEPVSSDDLDGLRMVRDLSPPGMEITAGEYGYDLTYFRRMLEAGAVDVLQADATRCAGITGFMRAAALSEAFHLPLSSHCAPSIHAHPACAAEPVRHIEYFHDHERIEHLLFDGALTPRHGSLYPDLSRPGLGLEFKLSDAKRFEV